MTPLGVALIDPATGTILQEWDSMPSVIAHGGEDRTGAIVGAEFAGGALLLERVLDVDPPPGNPPVTGQTSVVSGSRVVVTREYGAIDLMPLKNLAKAKIDAEAEVARSRHITLGSGQEREYALVAEDLERYAMRLSVNKDPLVENGVPIAYPALQASVAAGEAENIPAAYAFISAREGASANALMQIRQLRIAAKRAVVAATSIAQIESATQIGWP